MASIVITPEKKEKITKLIKSFKELDGLIEPFKEQKKELRSLYCKENDWLSNEEYSMVKKAYNAVKSELDLDDLASFVKIAAKEMPGFGGGLYENEDEDEVSSEE